MRVVVTGGAGFIGSHLIEALLARGNEVACIEHPNASRHWIADLPIEFRPIGLEDQQEIADVCAGADVVFHLAALLEARRPSDLFRVNVEGTANVFRAAAGLPVPPHVILMSSIAATGPCQNGERLTSDSAPYPISTYGKSKLRAEAVAHAYGDRLPITIVRLPTVYGPRERDVLTLFRLVKRGVALTVGGWDRELSLIYVKDVIHGLIRCATTPAAGCRTYILAHPESVTWREFATAVGDVVGRVPRLVSVPTWAAGGIALLLEYGAGIMRRAALLNRERVKEMAQERWVCDPSPSIRDLGFTARYPMSLGVAETAAWYQEAQWL